MWSMWRRVYWWTLSEKTRLRGSWKEIKKKFECNVCGGEFTGKIVEGTCWLFMKRKKNSNVMCFAKGLLINVFWEYILKVPWKGKSSIVMCVTESLLMKNGLDRHFRRFHGEEKQKFKCNECDKGFTDENDLRRHFLRFHKKEKINNSNVMHKNGFHEKR